MLFSSASFLFFFLPVVLAGYYLLNEKLRIYFLLLASLLFYAWEVPKYIYVMILSIAINYVAGIAVDRCRTKRDSVRKIILVCAVACNLGLLFYFKYMHFTVSNLNRLLNTQFVVKDIALPLGISFFTFKGISYVVDLHKKRTKVQENPAYLAFYMSFFPQLLAGPIARYRDMAEYIYARSVSFALFSEGVQRFVVGFSKKILLANNMALIADRAFAQPDVERSVIYAWLGAVAYAFQIFFDFSGYSDMAIGLGKMFGFPCLENFNYPYISRSVSEFWRRWHISLSTWFRDYVFSPLSGSLVRRKWKRTPIFLSTSLVVWLLTGLWHGASWNFVLWGLFYFVLLALEMLTGWPQKLKTPSAKAAYRIFTLLCILGGWVLFRAAGTSAAVGYFLSMFALGGNPAFCDGVILTFREYWLFLLFALLCSTDLFQRLRTYLNGDSANRALRVCANTLSVGFYTFCVVWCVSFIILGAHNPFIYFNF